MKPIFSIQNRHAIPEGCPDLPCIDNDTSNCYRSYFENACGDQSIFVFNRSTKEAALYCGDAGWKEVPVINSTPVGLTLSHDEGLWLNACLLAIQPARIL